LKQSGGVRSTDPECDISDTEEQELLPLAGNQYRERCDLNLLLDHNNGAVPKRLFTGRRLKKRKEPTIVTQQVSRYHFMREEQENLAEMRNIAMEADCELNGGIHEASVLEGMFGQSGIPNLR
jgi:hypothetical protein